MADPKVEEEWTKFWEPLLSKPGYGVSLAGVKKELYDYSQLLNNISNVFCEVTGGRISKPNTDASAVIGEFNDYVDQLIKDACEEAVEEERQNAGTISNLSPDWGDDDDIPF